MQGNQWSRRQGQANCHGSQQWSRGGRPVQAHWQGAEWKAGCACQQCLRRCLHHNECQGKAFLGDWSCWYLGQHQWSWTKESLPLYCVCFKVIFSFYIETQRSVYRVFFSSPILEWWWKRPQGLLSPCHHPVVLNMFSTVHMVLESQQMTGWQQIVELNSRDQMLPWFPCGQDLSRLKRWQKVSLYNIY